MELVQPIRDKEVINKFKNELLKNGYRDYMLFVIGINTGLRISDILKLRVEDVKDKTHIVIREQKTSKRTRVLINSMLREDIENYVECMDNTEYLFKSRKGQNKPITRVQAYRILSKAGKHLGMSEVGTHTLRKTFGYWHYKQYKDVAILQDIFNHSAPSITLRYIGINDDVKDNTIENFYL
ncbi:integrase (plasmid) [Clostridium botulinum B2 433]|uniref:site-specific integrase n=1 Tax=Clostridium botulinum TaxID=1491 RepID=UPI0007DF68C5|nr:site-specific integrase [Clostridium botulinum]KEI83562.1 integrase [Clostridium botulinum B2 267]KEI83573.1 integrase [Clostridium botulinum B2 433]NFL57473.1 site-specific integrase [Clostridium botulinum]